MQVAERAGFDKRVQYYASREYSIPLCEDTVQISKGEDYTKLKPTVFIGILDFKYFKDSDYLSYHSLLDEKTFEHKFKDLRFAFIELPKFKKSAKELENLIDQWTFFLKNSEKLSFIPEDVSDQGLKEAYRDADRHTWTKVELKDYDDASMAVQDARGAITLAEERAVEGTKMEIAGNLKALGVAIADIAKATGLS